MAMRFVCETCGKLLQTEDIHAGMSVACPGCNATVTVPQPGQVAFVEFSCLSCGTSFRVPVEMAGKHTHCPDCNTSLEVPGPTQTSAPASFVTEPPPVPSPPLSSSTVATGAPPHRRVPIQEDKPRPVYVPGQKKTSPATVIMLVLCGVIALFVLIMIIIKANEKKPVKTYDLLAKVGYNTGTDRFELKNQSAGSWKNVRIQIHVGSVVYSYSVNSVMAPGDDVNIPIRSFSADGHPPLDPFKTRPQKIVISAIRSDGNKGSRTINWWKRENFPTTRPGVNTKTPDATTHDMGTEPR